MFISVLELFKIGIGPSSSHTMGPMVAANNFLSKVSQHLKQHKAKSGAYVRCTLKDSLAHTGKGHATDRGIILGLNGYKPKDIATCDIEELRQKLEQKTTINIGNKLKLGFIPGEHIVFDKENSLPQHPNGMIFEVVAPDGKSLFSQTYFSIGGGFISTPNELSELVAPLKMIAANCPYPFASANLMLEMAASSGLSVAEMKYANEISFLKAETLEQGLDDIWRAMAKSVENGLRSDGILPGGLNLSRRAQKLYTSLKLKSEDAEVNDWLCAYAMAVNEENAAGHMVVTAPTNGAAGVIPAILYYLIEHQTIKQEEIRKFLLTAAAIGGLIKHLSSISGAEVGCQGEVGAASAMAAAGLCAVRGGTPEQIEHAAEIALEHHLGLTCDPVNGLVQVPCIERNGFGAIKAYTAASLTLKSSGQHFMPLDNCIAAMKQTGEEMSHKLKETSLGGLAVSITEC